MATLIVMVGLWVLLGLAMAKLAGRLWPDSLPIGANGDLIVALLSTVITGLLDWYVVSLLGMEGLLRFVIALTEPPLVALFILWLLRRLKKD